MSCCEIWNNIKNLFSKIYNYLNKEESIYFVNYIFFISGLLFTLLYCYIDYFLDKDGRITVVAGTILALHGMLAQSTLSKIKDYTTYNIHGKEFLIKKELPIKFKIQKDLSFFYIFIGTSAGVIITLKSLAN